MTANQLKSRELDLKSEELEEKKKTGRVERAAKTIGAILPKVSFKDSLFGTANDPSWYNLDKQLVNDVAQLPYGKPLGIGEDVNAQWMKHTDKSRTASGNTSYHKAAFPGVMRLSFCPTVGDGKQSDADAINVAMRNVYSFVRHANSGSRNYDAPDLMQYMLAMDSIYTLISHCCRAYSIALTAKSHNRYYPKALLKAAGFSTAGGASILDNLAQFRAEINMAIQKAGIFNVPAKFPFFNRHIWLAGNIFKDAQHHRSRNFVFVPALYYNTADNNGTQSAIRTITLLNGDIVGTGNWERPDDASNTSNVEDLTFEQAKLMLRYLIDQATKSEDFGIMSGDILKAFGENGVFKLQQIGEDFHVEAIYSPEVLSQIGGATIMPGKYQGAFIGQTNSGVIYQGTERIYGGHHSPYSEAGIYGYRKYPNATSGTDLPLAIPDCSRVTINMYKDEVKPDDNMVATRLSNIFEYSDIGYLTYTDPLTQTSKNMYYAEVKALTCASEIIDAITVYDYQYDGSLWTSEISDFEVLGTGTEAANAFVHWLQRVINQFEWAPRIRLCTDNSRYVTAYCDNEELANYIVINADVIEKLHAVAMLSLFAVPLLGNTARKY